MEKFLSNIPNTTEVIGVLIIGIVLLGVSFIRKLDKLAIITLIGMIVYAGYLYFKDNQSLEKSKNLLEKSEKLKKGE